MSIKPFIVVALSAGLLAACNKPAEPTRDAVAAAPAPVAAPADAVQPAAATKDDGGKGNGDVHPSAAAPIPPSK
jgi:hypothetical protein